MKLSKINVNGKSYKLTKEKEYNNSNEYTLLLGENGSGKSETIREIINILLRLKIPKNYCSKHNDILDSYLENRYKSTLRDKNTFADLTINFERNSIHSSFLKTNKDRVFIDFNGNEKIIKDDAYRFDFKVESDGGDIFIKEKVSNINIVSVSESPYIKFPIAQNSESLSYFYIGKKQEIDYEYMSSSSDVYVDQKTEQLSKAIIQTIEASNKTNVTKILEYLSFSDNISINLSIKRNYQYRLDNTNEIVERVLNSNSRLSSLGLNSSNEGNKGKFENSLSEALEFIKSKIKNNENNSLDRAFDTDSMNFEFSLFSSDSSIKHISTLLKFNILNVLSLSFEYKGKKVDSIHLSSGQLCILNNIFGIASKIKDNTFVFIDEPEISLHPSWQSSFIKLLEETFSSYNGCHFIIATHSPHIVSNINKDNSNIVLMKEGNSNEMREYDSYQGWTIDEILQDVMGMDETRSQLYINLIRSFNNALDTDNSTLALESYNGLSKIIHPDNALRKILEIQMIGVGDD